MKVKTSISIIIFVVSGLVISCRGGGALYELSENLVSGNITIQVLENPIISKDNMPQTNKNIIKGIRDFVWCIDEENKVISDNENYIAYANVFYEEEAGPAIYRLENTKNGKWDYTPINLERTEGIDDVGTNLGSVLKTKSGYYLYYSGLCNFNNTLRYHTYNVAYSLDGINFERIAAPLLTEDNFKEIQHIGIPYTCYGNDGKMYMVCESISENEYSIYGAVSNDGIHFSPLNDGNPVLANDNIAWGDGGCANPKLYPIEKNLFLIGFNAFSKQSEVNSWAIGAGLLKIDNNKTQIIQISDILLGRESIDAARIESAFFISPNGFGNEIIFFTTPSYDATNNAAIYKGLITYK